jgi:hypothetical protein
MTRPDDAAPVPDLYLERYVLGELPEDERRRIEGLLILDPALQGRLQALERSDAEIVRRLPAPLMDERIRSRARAAGISRTGTAPGPRARGWLVPALAATAVVLAVGGGVVRPPAPADGIRLKGGEAELVVYRKTAAGSERLGPGAFAVSGDLIRIGYRAAGRAYGAIVSTDGAGNVTQHLPRAGERAASLVAGGTVLLDFSYELDDAPRWERFYLVTGDEPFELEPVRRAAREVAAAGSEAAPPLLEIRPGLEQSIFTLAKESVS